MIIRIADDFRNFVKYCTDHAKELRSHSQFGKMAREIQDRLDDYADAEKKVWEEKCPSDERHCGCVAFLRDQVRSYQKALVLITTLNNASEQKKLAEDALSGNDGDDVSVAKHCAEYWVEKYDMLQDKYNELEKDYADVCRKRLEAAESFTKQIIDLENKLRG